MTTRCFALLGLLLLAAVSLGAQERITLTAGEPAPTVARYQVAQMSLTFNDPDTADDEGAIQMTLVGVERAVTVTCLYSRATTPTGTFLIDALNKANLSSAYTGNATTGSLKFRIFHRLVVMNEAPQVCGRSLAGTLTGTPQD